MRPRAAVLAVLLLAALAGPAADASGAGGQAKPLYRLVYSGSGSYGVDLVSPDGQRGRVAASFSWRIAYRAQPVRHGLVEWQHGEAAGSGRWSISSEADSCSAGGNLALKGDGGGLVVLRGRSLETIVFPDEGDYESTGSGGGGPCDTGDFWRQWVQDFSQIGSEGTDPLTSWFEAPKGWLTRRQGITMHTTNLSPTFPSLVPARDCGFGGQGQCSQEFSWRGTVRIRRAGR
ncbi:MAG: hypothetical protein U0R71_17485 [Solirubrobacterales bacterium]